VIGDTSAEVITASLACVVAGVTLVPLASTLARPALEHILAKTKPVVVFADTAIAVSVASALVATGVTPALCCSMSREDGHSLARPPPPGWMSLASVIAAHAALASDEALSFVCDKRSPDSLVAVLFTSGSTGKPKGAVFTETLALPTEGISGVQPFVRFDFQVRTECAGGWGWHFGGAHTFPPTPLVGP